MKEKQAKFLIKKTNNKIKDIILALFLLLASSYQNLESKELSIQECEDIHQSIRLDTTVTLDKKIDSWNKRKEQCSSHGLYYQHMINYYVATLDYPNAKETADYALKHEKKIDKFILKNILSYSAYLDMMNPKLHQSARSKIKRIINEYHDLYEGYTLMGFLEFSEKKFEESKYWYLKAIKETAAPDKLARAYAALSSSYYYLNESSQAVLDAYKKAWNLDRGRALVDDVASHCVVLSLLREKEIDEAKFIVNMQEKYIESIEHNENFIASKKAISDYEKILKK